MSVYKIKKYIKEPKLLLICLINKGFFNWMSDKKFIEFSFKLRMNQKLDLKNPKTFNQKLQWLKLYDRKNEYINMVDKYEAKKYAQSIVGSEYIIPNLGVYDKFDQIDFSKLPNKFVIKCTHDSGGLVICRDKNNFDLELARTKINHCLNKNFYYVSREWPYKNVKPRIIIEEYMENEGTIGLVDYKFFCFNGEPKFIYVSQGLEKHETASIDFLDMEYNRMNFKRKDYKSFEVLPPKPIGFEKMKEMARKFSKGIPFIRVDFYEIKEKIYFSELTFFPNAGCIPFSPEIWDYKIGELLNLPEEKRIDNEK